jgi:hypothetical protein
LLLANLIADTILSAIETASREEADRLFSGSYSSSYKSLNSSIVTSTDATKPGLGVMSWISNGTDMLTSAIAAPDIRLYPTGLKNILGNGDAEMGFRALYPQQGLDTFGGTLELASSTWVMV